MKVTLLLVLAQIQARPQLRAGQLTSDLVLDGRLSEAAWATADSAILTEYEPAQGVSPAERTVVKVLASADVIVFGIRCDDQDPAPAQLACQSALDGRPIELREGEFNRVELRRVRWEVQEPGSGCLDQLAHARHLVGAEVVQDERVAGP